MKQLKAYAELPCDNIRIISQSIYEYVATKTDLLEKPINGSMVWHFIDCKELLAHVPELLEFFKHHKLVPRHAAVTIIEEDGQLGKHIDEPPVVAKINFPVFNTDGWANRWYEDDELIAELHDMKQPIVFNSQITHSVEKTTATEKPRIVASFTFYNEPLDMLK